MLRTPVTLIPLRRFVLAGALGLHLLAIIIVSLRELSWLIANGLTVAPASWCEPSRRAGDLALDILGENQSATNPYHHIISTYLNLAAIEGGYGFFAPNISDSYQLTFEFKFADGHKEYDRPLAFSEESALRVIGLLDEIASTRLDPLREALVKLLAQEATHYHPGAIALSAKFSSISLSSDVQVIAPPKILYTYDFTLERH